jgi:hypothetical protein
MSAVLGVGSIVAGVGLVCCFLTMTFGYTLDQQQASAVFYFE